MEELPARKAEAAWRPSETFCDVSEGNFAKVGIAYFVGSA